MADADLLRQKTLLLLKRDREYLALQQRFARAAGWLETGERLAQRASSGDRALLEAEWPAALVERLQFQCALLVEPRRGGPLVRVAAGCLPKGEPEAVEEARRLVRAHPAGVHNGEGDHPLARMLGLRRFLWATLSHPQVGPHLAVAGFGERTWQFFPELVAEDLAYFRMTCRQLEALGGQLASIEGLTTANVALEERTAELAVTLSELEATQEQLVHREKLAAVGQLAAGVAHEINNPASYVLSNLKEIELQVAALPGPAGAELGELAHDAVEGIQRVVELTRDLTVFARPDRERAEERIELGDAVRTAERLVRNRLRHQATVRLSVEGDPEVSGHRGRLTQVFVNLLMNALQALPQGRRPGENLVEVTCREEAGRAVATVRDNGTGIAPADLPHLFEPFYTTKVRGTGLGLGIARQIVDRHGGTVSVASELGHGTTFTLSFPAAPPVAERPPAQRAQQAG